MIQIDGSYLEGGGQIVRTALALSSLTQKPFRVDNIRKGRKKPGLKAQHLKAIETLKEMTEAKVKGAKLGSEEIQFRPTTIKFRNINVDIGTAGSITLYLQALLPVVLFSDKTLNLKITGGTDTKFSMPADYMINVLIPHLRKYADIKASVVRRGYYPKGGGKVELRIKPRFNLNKELLKEIRKRTGFNVLEQNRLVYVKGLSHASKELMKARVAERQAKTAKYLLNDLDIPVEISRQYVDSDSIGSAITLWALFSRDGEMDLNNPVLIGADALGERKKSAEKVGQEAAIRLRKEIDSNAPIDTYLADQLLPYLALSGGKIRVSNFSDHAKTNIYVIEKFLDVKFKIQEDIIKV